MLTISSNWVADVYKIQVFPRSKKAQQLIFIILSIIEIGFLTVYNEYNMVGWTEMRLLHLLRQNYWPDMKLKHTVASRYPLKSSWPCWKSILDRRFHNHGWWIWIANKTPGWWGAALQSISYKISPIFVHLGNCILYILRCLLSVLRNRAL